MNKKTAADRNYGVPEEMITKGFKKRVSEITYDFYIEHPDTMPYVDWKLNEKELKRAVRSCLIHRNFRYALHKFNLLNKIDETVFVYFVTHENYEDYREAVTTDFRNSIRNKNVTFTSSDEMHLYDHLGDLYYAASLDEAQKEDTLAFLNTPENNIVKEMKKAHNLGLDEDALDHNTKIFAKYRALLSESMKEIRTTDFAYFSSRTYRNLKKEMDRFNAEFCERMSVNNDVFELRRNVQKFGRLLNKIGSACDQYVENYQPKNGKAYKNPKLSRIQVTRLNAVQEIKQLQALFNTDSEQLYMFPEGRNPFSAAFNQQRDALKLLKKSIKNRSEYGRLLLDEELRNEKLAELAEGNSVRFYAPQSAALLYC